MISPILNGEFPPQAGFSHKNLDPEECSKGGKGVAYISAGQEVIGEGVRCSQKGGGEQVALASSKALASRLKLGGAGRHSPHILTTKNQC